MNVLVGIISGIAAAVILNKLLGDKIAKKETRIGLKVAAFFVCIILGAVFAGITSLQTVLDAFIEKRIQYIETQLVESFPNENILEKSIEADEIASLMDNLQQSVKGIKTNNYFENLIFDAFSNPLIKYINVIKNGLYTITMDNKQITVKSVVYSLKDLVMRRVSKYIIYGQIALLILLAVFIGIYAGIAVFSKKTRNSV
jgi:hypothetical protein